MYEIRIAGDKRLLVFRTNSLRQFRILKKSLTAAGVKFIGVII